MSSADSLPPNAPRGSRLLSATLWLLPVYALALGLGTLTHEPDHTSDFAEWSRYVSTDRFVVSHVAASVFGAGVGLVGVAALMVFLVRGPAATTALLGGACTIVGNTMFVAMFGVAAFAQPAMGRAFLDGDETMRAFYDDVYGSPLLVNFAIGALLFLAGAVLLGVALARTAPGLRWVGYGYAASLVVFLVAGFTVPLLQPVAAAAAVVVTAVVALRLPGSVTPAPTATTRARTTG